MVSGETVAASLTRSASALRSVGMAKSSVTLFGGPATASGWLTASCLRWGPRPERRGRSGWAGAEDARGWCGTERAVRVRERSQGEAVLRVRRGPGRDVVARAVLAEQARATAMRLTGVTRDDVDELFRDAVGLPEIDLALQVELPRLMTPELMRAQVVDDEDDFEAALDPVIAGLDTPVRRATLARAVVDLTAARRVDPDVAAVAMIDLTMPEWALFASSVAEEVCVAAGAARTPAGLVLTAR